MRLDVTTAADFAKYYSESYVRAKRIDKGVFYIPPRPMERADSVTMYPIGENGVYERENVIYIPFSELETHIAFGLPPLGMVVNQNLLMFVSQNFKRTGMRGLSRYRGHLQILTQDTPIYKQFASVNGVWNLSYALQDGRFARDVLWPTYVNAKDSIDLIRRGEVAAIAINRDFGIGLSGVYKNPILYYKTDAIGEIVDSQTIRLNKYAEEYRLLVNEMLGDIAVEVVCNK